MGVAKQFGSPQLGEFLIANRVISRHELQRALALQSDNPASLGTILLAIEAVEESELLECLGRYHGVSTVDARELARIPPSIVNLVPRRLAARHLVLPFKLIGNTVCIASSRPGDVIVENEIALETSRLTRTFLGLDLRISEALESYYGIEAPTGASEVFRKLRQNREVAAAEPFPFGPAKSVISSLLTGKAPRPSDTDTFEETDLASSTGHDIEWERFEHPRRRLSELLDQSGETDGIVSSKDATEIGATHDDQIGARPRHSNEGARPGRTGRDQIAVRLLSGTSTFSRRVLLASRGTTVLGWKGDGSGIIPRRLAEVRFEVDQCPPFFSVYNGAPFWLGPLLPAPGTTQLLRVLGGRSPSSCLILPIDVGSRTVAFLYLDNGSDGVIGAPVAEVQELARAAGSELEKLIEQSKRGA